MYKPLLTNLVHRE